MICGKDKGTASALRGSFRLRSTDFIEIRERLLMV